jgi:uncharacterized Zn finger protein (UPF0148 family)
MQPAAPEISTCPTCGGPLEKTADGGLGCTVCLLRAGIGSEEEVAQDSTHEALQGDLQEAARLLSEINEKTSNDGSVIIKINQLRLERRYTEAIRLLQARLAQFHFDSEFYKGIAQVNLAFA